MALADDYERQFGWRSWDVAMDALPPTHGALILDLGCGIGDQAAMLAARGARVIGIDGNEELLAAARKPARPGVEFRLHDLRAIPESAVLADGIWASFSAAYFVDLVPVLRSWTTLLRPGGWVALTEIDDLFGHEPLSAEAKAAFEAYSADALLHARYDFHMGRKLRRNLEAAGLRVEKELVLPDRELAFDGPAASDVLAAWSARLDRMKLLHDHCGARFPAIRDEFLACLGRGDHRSTSAVRFCLATRT